MRLRFGFALVSSLLIAVACGGGDDTAAPEDGLDASQTQNDAAQRDGGGGGNDGSDMDVVDAAPPEFTPSALGARLVLWLDAAKSIGLVDSGLAAGATIDSWGDLSGNQNNAGQPGALKPTALPGTSDAAVGGLPVVAFDGTRFLLVPSSASLAWGTGDFGMFVVFRSRNPLGSFGLIVGKYNAVAPFAGPNLYSNYFAPQPTTEIVGRADGNHLARSSDGGFNDDKPHIAGMRRSGATIEVRVDGVASVNADAGSPDGSAIDVSAGDASVAIGYRNGAGLRGDIAEIVCVKGNLTDAEVSQIEAYFRAKYGL
jgi:hypothetical protein